MPREMKLQAQLDDVRDYISCGDDPAVYVGTYGKYNSGSIFGAWIALADCSDYEEFMDVCRRLHADEEDPEFMFQDFEGFPAAWYEESGIDEKVFDKIKDFAEMDEEEQEAYRAYIDCTDDDDIDNFHERYMGYWESEEDFAEHIVNECFDLDRLMGRLSIYFDYKAYARDLFYEYKFCDGHVFSD